MQAIPTRGVDPAADAHERQLQKLATRGVVLLFNAVAKAQKQKADAEAGGSKAMAAAAKAAKTGVFAELHAGAKAVAAGLPASAARRGAKHKQQHAGDDGDDGEGGGTGWAVLGEGFPGLTGGVKMKDWDRAAADSDEEGGAEAALAGSDSGSDGDGGAW